LEPGFQRGFQNTGHRSNPDVGYDADPNSGFYVCSNGGWYAVGGTSAGAPQWAALVAIANQGRAAAGRAALGGNALQALYSLSTADFHDVTSGNNGYAAGVGYDAVTGRGSPVANLVIRDLANYGATTSNTGSGGTSGGGGTSAVHHVDWVFSTGSPGSDAPLDLGTAALGMADLQSASAGRVHIAASSNAGTSVTASRVTDHLGSSLATDTFATASTDGNATSSLASGADRATDDGLAAVDDRTTAAWLTAGNDTSAASDPTQGFDRIDSLIDQFFDSGATASDGPMSADAVDACLSGTTGGDA
jgi:hypothetical protein